MDWGLVGSAGPIGGAVFLSYVLVLGNVFGGFALAEPGDGYIRSPYWLGLRSDTVVAIVVFQALAVVGYLLWVPWLFTQGATITDSILDTRLARLGLLNGFLLASTAWPYAAYYYMLQPTLPRALGAAAPLWVAAACVILLLAGTFEARAPPYAVVGILLVGSVVVLADGIGWAALAIKRVV